MTTLAWFADYKDVDVRTNVIDWWGVLRKGRKLSETKTGPLGWMQMDCQNFCFNRTPDVSQ